MRPCAESLRREVLAAQDNAYRLWRRRAAEAVLRLHQDAGYPLWRNALSRTARATLGDDAHLVEDPEGGVQAELGRRRLDLSLSAIATRAIDNVAPEADGFVVVTDSPRVVRVSALWSKRNAVSQWRWAIWFG